MPVIQCIKYIDMNLVYITKILIFKGFKSKY